MTKGRSCNVCSAPREALAVINDQLKRKIPMSRIAKECGISKSAIGRHSIHCLQKQTLNKLRSGKFGSDPQDRLISVSTVDIPGRKAGVPLNAAGRETEIRPTDTVVIIRYESPNAHLKPIDLSALCNHPDDPQIQKLFAGWPRTSKDDPPPPDPFALDPDTDLVN